MKNKQKTKVIYFVRHGDYHSNSQLSQRGIEQMKDVVESIKETEGKIDDIVIIYHSPMGRAKLSAEEMGKHLVDSGIEMRLIREDDLFCENYCVSSVVQKIRLSRNYYNVVISHQPDLEDYLRIQMGYGKFLRREE